MDLGKICRNLNVQSHIYFLKNRSFYQIENSLFRLKSDMMLWQILISTLITEHSDSAHTGGNPKTTEIAANEEAVF